MRYVERGKEAAPAALAALDRHGEAEIERARRHQLDPDPEKGSFSYTRYRDKDVKRRLEAIFHGKCAYCETFYGASSPMDVEHFRPKGGVAGEDHPGYWWLAASWSNLFPSCPDCNRRRDQHIVEMHNSLTQLQLQGRNRHLSHAPSGKHDSFPLDQNGVRALLESDDLSAELPLLLDPCTDKPEEHLVFSIDAGKPALVSPRRDRQGRPSQKGLASIHLYGLNRLGLVQDRTRVLRHLDFLGEVLVEIARVIEALRETAELAGISQVRLLAISDQLEVLKDKILLEIKVMTGPKAPYSTMATTWLKAFMRSFEEVQEPLAIAND